MKGGYKAKFIDSNLAFYIIKNFIINFELSLIRLFIICNFIKGYDLFGTLSSHY